MDAQSDKKQPAQVPGDAESPPKGAGRKTAAEAIRHSDPTEPVQSAQNAERKSG
jgi:hypothetical protein